MYRNNLPIALALLSGIMLAAHLPAASVPAMYVDGSKGSDSNAGTQQQPLRTLSHAISTAITQTRSGAATSITVLPGVYRESLSVIGSTGAPLKIQAAQTGTAVISGADVWTGWIAYSGHPGLYTHSWPYSWGYCSAPSGPTEQQITLRQEQIFVNGFHLTQVLSLANMRAGTFWVNEGQHTVYIWPQSGVTISTATIEVATRPSLLTIQNNTGVTVTGMTFNDGSGCTASSAAVQLSGTTNATLGNDQFLWNNGVGLAIYNSSNAAILNSIASYNGHDGMYAQYDTNITYKSDTVSYNNWRGAQGSFYGFNVAGMKWGEVHGATVTGFGALFNQAHGVHFDTDIKDVSVSNITSVQNAGAGIAFEASLGPISILNSKICGNNLIQGKYSGGAAISDVANLTISSSTLYNNGETQFEVEGRPSGISVTDFQTRAASIASNSNFAFDSNIVEATGTQYLFQDGYLNQNWAELTGTLNSDYNTWSDAGNPSAFLVPVPKGNTLLNLAGWKSATSQDVHSVFGNPTGVSAACEVAPAGPDYQLLLNAASMSVNPGSTTSYIFIVVPLAFQGTVSLTVDLSAVPNASASFSTSAVQTSGTSTLTVATKSSTPAGTYPVTVIANSGNLTRTVTASLVVN